MGLREHCLDRMARADERSDYYFALAKTTNDPIREGVYRMEGARWAQEAKAWKAALDHVNGEIVADEQRRRADAIEATP